MIKLKDKDIYARVDTKNRTTVINKFATIDDKNIDGFSPSHRDVSLDELIDQTTHWLVIQESYIHESYFSVIPISDVQFTERESIQLQGIEQVKTQISNKETTASQYIKHASVHTTDELSPFPTDLICKRRPGSSSGFHCENMELWLQDAEIQIKHHNTHPQSDWVIAYDENGSGGNGDDVNYKTFIPIEDLEIADYGRDDSVTINLPSTARTTWNGPPEISRYSIDATRIESVRAENVPDEYDQQ